MPEYEGNPLWKRHPLTVGAAVVSAALTLTSAVMFVHCLLQTRPTCVPWEPPPTGMWGALAAASPIALAAFGSMAWNRRLANAPEHICRRCGYDRRGLAENAPCPECGGK